MAATNDLPETILIPTDGSDGALAGAKRGVNLPGDVGAEVNVFLVIVVILVVRTAGQQGVVPVVAPADEGDRCLVIPLTAANGRRLR